MAEEKQVEKKEQTREALRYGKGPKPVSPMKAGAIGGANAGQAPATLPAGAATPSGQPPEDEMFGRHDKEMGDMHGRHASEMGEMHKRHASEHKDMMKRHGDERGKRLAAAAPGEQKAEANAKKPAPGPKPKDKTAHAVS
jgi:hypothetical protein